MGVANTLLACQVFVDEVLRDMLDKNGIRIDNIYVYLADEAEHVYYVHFILRWPLQNGLYVKVKMFQRVLQVYSLILRIYF